MAIFVSGGGGGSVQQHIFTGACETAAATAAKVITLDDSSGFSLTNGIVVGIRFVNGNSSENPTLNINNTGAKSVEMSFATSGGFSGGDYNKYGQNETIFFTYYDDGFDGSWIQSPSGNNIYRLYTDYMKKGVDYVTAGQLSGTTLGIKATAEGIGTTASGDYSHAEGSYSQAKGYASHAETYGIAMGNASHAEGNGTATGGYSHAEGQGTIANRQSQHVFGEYNVLDDTGSTPYTRGTYIEIVGNGTDASASLRSNARTLDWSGNEVLAGKLTVGAAPTNNMDVTTKQYVDNAIGGIDLSGYMQKGVDYVTAGQASGTTLGTKATAEGDNTTASGVYSHAEGWNTTARAGYSHAEGNHTTAKGDYSHAEGYTTTASGIGSHAEGYGTQANGSYSHTEGYYTTAQRKSQHIFGEYNVLDTGGTSTTARGDYVEIVGNGTSSSARSNARTLDWSGNEILAGSLTVGSAPTTSNVARNITVSTSEPAASDGMNGDIWFVYEE